MTSRTYALLDLAHPGPSAATVLVALAFMVLLSHRLPAVGLLLLVTTMLGCQQVAISLHNDWCDRELDARTKPWRAIPSGLITSGTIHVASWVLAIASLALAVSVGWMELALDTIGLAAGFGYNAALKRTALSWLPFSIAFPLLPLFGAAAIAGAERVLRIAPWCFLAGAPLGVAIHLADTLPDVGGDSAHGLRGLGHRLGARGSRALSGALFLVGGLLLAAGFRQIVG